MYVYLASNHPCTRYKIGFSAHIKLRASGLRGQESRRTGDSARFLRVIAGGRDVERELHRKFADIKLSGPGLGREWFAESPAIIREFEKRKPISLDKFGLCAHGWRGCGCSDRSIWKARDRTRFFGDQDAPQGWLSCYGCDGKIIEGERHVRAGGWRFHYDCLFSLPPDPARLLPVAYPEVI